MSEELKDPAIKLFGKTIQLPETSPPPPSGDEETNNEEEDDENESHKDDLGENLDDHKDEMETSNAKELLDQNTDPMVSDSTKGPPVDNDCSTTKTLKSEEAQGEASNSQEKVLKKPDKILPCPRCNSMETKFCYFNNYNVNQPRHFCKNCQRYWTAGGTMRNVPVGAGRRKNKSPLPHYRQVSVETLTNVQTDYPNGIQQPVLTFGSHAPLCESMASVLNIADKTMQNCLSNGFQKPEVPGVQVSKAAAENGDDHSGSSSVTAASLTDEVNKTVPELVRNNINSFPPNLTCYAGTPLPYLWSPIQWNSAVPPPGYFPPSYPMPFFPAATYWGYNVASSWNVPWVSPPTASLTQPPQTSGPNSPTLGKHSRDELMSKPLSSEEKPSKESNPEKCLWVPKTLRIDDPGDAAKSSIWATLGIKHDSADSVGGSLFSAFRSKNDEKSSVSQNSTVLQANPAALSRSRDFNESL